MNKCSCAALLVRANCATKTIMTDIKDSTYVINLKANNFAKAKKYGLMDGILIICTLSSAPSNQTMQCHKFLIIFLGLSSDLLSAARMSLKH